MHLSLACHRKFSGTVANFSAKSLYSNWGKKKHLPPSFPANVNNGFFCEILVKVIMIRRRKYNNTFNSADNNYNNNTINNSNSNTSVTTSADNTTTSSNSISNYNCIYWTNICRQWIYFISFKHRLASTGGDNYRSSISRWSFIIHRILDWWLYDAMISSMSKYLHYHRVECQPFDVGCLWVWNGIIKQEIPKKAVS